MKLHIEYIPLIFMVLVAFNSLNAQENKVKDILAKVTERYEQEEKYQIKVTYTMYRGFTGDNVTESYHGTMRKIRDFSDFEVLGRSIVQFPKIQLIIDQKKKVITYTEKKTADHQNSPLQVIDFLKTYDNTKVTEKGNMLLCEMMSSAKNVQLSYSKVVLYIDETSYEIKKQELFFANVIPFVNKEKNKREMDVARLIITMDSQPDVAIKKPTISQFIVKKADGKLETALTYKNYQLINQTN